MNNSISNSHTGEQADSMVILQFLYVWGIVDVSLLLYLCSFEEEEGSGAFYSL